MNTNINLKKCENGSITYRFMNILWLTPKEEYRAIITSIILPILQGKIKLLNRDEKSRHIVSRINPMTIHSGIK